MSKYREVVEAAHVALQECHQYSEKDGDDTTFEVKIFDHTLLEIRYFDGCGSGSATMNLEDFSETGDALHPAIRQACDTARRAAQIACPQ